MTMQGYDLDDTLAGVDFRDATQHPLAQLFTHAPVLYTPTTDFIVITGRPATTPERAATSAWLREHQPHCRGIRYVPSGHAQATAQRKSVVINQERLSDYTDNNRDVLAAMAALVRARLWVMTAGRRTPFVDTAALAAVWAPGVVPGHPIVTPSSH